MNQANSNKNRISFHFHPSDSNFAVEKSITGSKNKKRYLKGVSSGIKKDSHEERMTKVAIDDFIEQAKKSEILLFPDVHGIKSTDDIGRLVEASILPDGNWQTEFELYDGSEGAQNYQVQKANVLWAQTNGLPPYKKKLEKGFSIEGYIPDDGILQSDEHGGKRVINKVLLDGVVVVPRPAYQDSVASAVYKALGEKPPWQIKKDILGKLREKVNQEKIENEYFKKKWEIQEALEDSINDVMRNNDLSDKRELIESLFDEFKSIMSELILSSEPLFASESEGTESSIITRSAYGDVVKQDASHIEKQLAESLRQFFNTFGGKNNGKK